MVWCTTCRSPIILGLLTVSWSISSLRLLCSVAMAQQVRPTVPINLMRVWIAAILLVLVRWWCSGLTIIDDDNRNKQSDCHHLAYSMWLWYCSWTKFCPSGLCHATQKPFVLVNCIWNCHQLTTTFMDSATDSWLAYRMRSALFRLIQLHCCAISTLSICWTRHYDSWTRLISSFSCYLLRIRGT
jgi:hypothetical protein